MLHWTSIYRETLCRSLHWLAEVAVHYRLHLDQKRWREVLKNLLQTLLTILTLSSCCYGNVAFTVLAGYDFQQAFTVVRNPVSAADWAEVRGTLWTLKAAPYVVSLPVDSTFRCWITLVSGAGIYRQITLTKREAACNLPQVSARQSVHLTYISFLWLNLEVNRAIRQWFDRQVSQSTCWHAGIFSYKLGCRPPASQFNSFRCQFVSAFYMALLTFWLFLEYSVSVCASLCQPSVFSVTVSVCVFRPLNQSLFLPVLQFVWKSICLSVCLHAFTCARLSFSRLVCWVLPVFNLCVSLICLLVRSTASCCQCT